MKHLDGRPLLERAKVPEVLRRFPGLRIRPGEQELVLTGHLDLTPAVAPFPYIKRRFNLRLVVFSLFPESSPRVWELDQQIPEDHHCFNDGSFCLGSTVEVRLAARRGLIHFVDQLVLPYLYGFAYKQEYGTMPFGERSHGQKGLIEAYEDLHDLQGEEMVTRFLWLSSLPEQRSSHQPCFCGSNRLLTNCHQEKVRSTRAHLGGSLCLDAYTAYVFAKEPATSTPRTKRLISWWSRQDGIDPSAACTELMIPGQSRANTTLPSPGAFLPPQPERHHLQRDAFGLLR